MNSLTTQHSDSDSDDVSEKNSSYPLILQLPSPISDSKSFAAPTRIISNWLKQNENDATSNPIVNRYLVNLRHFVNIVFYRTWQRRPREKNNRIKNGLFTIFFLVIIYICVLMNWTEDQPLPQINVTIPPVNVSLLGSTGDIFFIQVFCSITSNYTGTNLFM